MSVIHRRLRRSLIALVAIAAALSAGKASACSEMKRTQDACLTVCGCCETGGVDSRSTSGAMASAAIHPRAEMACEARPGASCACRSQAPVAPEPKPARGSAESRPETGQVSSLAFTDLERETRLWSALSAPAQPNAPRTPLYLRNERLLF